MVRLTLEAADGAKLAANLFEPAKAALGSVLIAPAMGVRQKLYARLAAYLAEAGLSTLTLDYRGIGDSAPGSLRGYRATFAEWGELDLAAAATELKRRAPGLPFFWIGHSAGGQLMGLVRGAPIRAALFLASGSAYWGHYRGLPRAIMFSLWHAAIPLVSPLAGCFPLSWNGGEDVPRGVAEEWARWGRNPEYVLSYARARDGDQAFDYSGPLRSYSFSDDAYAPPLAVQGLLDLYRRAKKELKTVTPAGLGKQRIGHFGLFRAEFQDPLWREARDWLLAQL